MTEQWLDETEMMNDIIGLNNDIDLKNDIIVYDNNQDQPYRRVFKDDSTFESQFSDDEGDYENLHRGPDLLSITEQLQTADLYEDAGPESKLKNVVKIKRTPKPKLNPMVPEFVPRVVEAAAKPKIDWSTPYVPKAKQTAAASTSQSEAVEKEDSPDVSRHSSVSSLSGSIISKAMAQRVVKVAPMTNSEILKRGKRNALLMNLLKSKAIESDMQKLKNAEIIDTSEDVVEAKKDVSDEEEARVDRNISVGDKVTNWMNSCDNVTEDDVIKPRVLSPFDVTFGFKTAPAVERKLFVEAKPAPQANPHIKRYQPSERFQKIFNKINIDKSQSKPKTGFVITDLLESELNKLAKK